jgi:DNA-binding protein H-NS
LKFTKALEERDKEALEELNNQQHVHEQKRKEKSKKLQNRVACQQPATAWKDKARKKGSSRLETGRTGGETKRERETTPSNANPKQPNLRNENPNRCSCGYEQVLGGCLVFT